MTLGPYLVRLREERGIGRKRLAELTGLSLSYLHYVENDRTLPGHDNLLKIARGLQLKPAEREELLRERDRVELERLGIDRPDITLLLKEYGRRLTAKDYEQLEQTIRRLAGRKRTRKK